MSKHRPGHRPDRSKRAGEVVEELRSLGVDVWLDEFGVHASPSDKIPLPLRTRLKQLKPWIAEHLALRGETVVSDSEEASHTDTCTPPAPELTREDKLRAGLKTSKRKYMNGEVLVNDVNNMGHYMRQLVKERERREAIERGEVSEGRYRTQFDPFNY
jgi:hypothetical protein